MTLQDIKNMTKEILTPADVAPILCCDPNVIRLQAGIDIKQLGFPAAKIPRAAYATEFGQNVLF